MLIYLRCYVEGCGRTLFGTLKALREHVSGPKNRHKLKGVFSSNSHAIDVCGVPVPDQKQSGSGITVYSGEGAPAASSTVTEAPPSVINSFGQLGGSSLASKLETIEVFDDNQSCLNGQYAAQHLGNASRIVPTTGTSHPRTENTKAVHAPETYEDSSSESEGEDENRYSKGIADTLERPMATEVTDTIFEVPGSTDPIEIACTVKEQQATMDLRPEAPASAVKTEWTVSPAQYPARPAVHSYANSPYIASQVSDLEIREAETGLHEASDWMTSRKRSAFTPPGRDPQLFKRLRKMDESLEN